MHSKGKGISASAIPYSRSAPAWLKTTPDQVVDQICKLARKGATPSQIGVVLRDSHGVAQVKVVTGMFIPYLSCPCLPFANMILQQVTRSSVS
jgi:small subunit ribosomal protein S13e